MASTYETSVAALKTFFRTVVLKTVFRVLLYTVLAGAVSFIAGLIIYKFGLAGSGLTPFMSILLGFLIVIIYTLSGTISGLALAVTGAMLAGLAQLEQSIHRLLAPVMARMLEKIPLGREGISLEEFHRVVEGTISAVVKDSASERLGVFSVLKRAARGFLRKILKSAKNFLLEDFVNRLQVSGETRVNASAIEKYGRERLVSLLLETVRSRIEAVKYTILISAALLLLVPVLLAFL